MGGEGSSSPVSPSVGGSSPLEWSRAVVQIVHIAALTVTSLVLCKWHMVDPLVALGAVTTAVASTAAEPSLLRRLLPARKDPES